MKHWRATLGKGEQDTAHAYLMLQLQVVAGVASSRFALHGARPSAQPSRPDYLGEYFSTKNSQQPFDLGFLYSWADKAGTLRMSGEPICACSGYARTWAACRNWQEVLRGWPQAFRGPRKQPP